MSQLLLPAPNTPPKASSKRRARKVFLSFFFGLSILAGALTAVSYGNNSENVLATIPLSELPQELHGAASSQELQKMALETPVEISLYKEQVLFTRIQTTASQLGYSRMYSEGSAQLSVNSRLQERFIEQLKQLHEQEAKPARVEWENRWVFFPEQEALHLSEQTIQQSFSELAQQLSAASNDETLKLRLHLDASPAPSSTLSDEDWSLFADRIESPLSVRVGEKDWELQVNNSRDWLITEEGDITLSEQKLRSWISTIAEEVYRPTNTIRITGTEEVRPSVFKAVTEGEFQEGSRINEQEAYEQILQAFGNLEQQEVLLREYEIPLKVYNEMKGVAYELLSVGYSEYSTGNAANRVHNIQTGLKRINQSYVPAGDQLSFNRLNGIINGEFRVGYAIMGNQATPSLGGGICQVSTTFYRALLNLGVPITQRQNHSWDLSYYQAGGYGLDATIYPAVGLDVKAENDLDSDLYIYSYHRPESEEAFVLIYGEGDGRKVNLEPHDEYIPWYGAKTLKWTQTIEFPDGTIKENQIVSRYRS